MPVRANKPMQLIVEPSDLIQAMQRSVGRPISPGYAQDHAAILARALGVRMLSMSRVSAARVRYALHAGTRWNTWRKPPLAAIQPRA